MKNFSEFRTQLEEDSDWLFEMTGVSSMDSGLDHYIWISPRCNAKHSIRIKVSNVPGKFAANDNFSLSVHLDKEPHIVAGTCKLKPKDLKKIQDWITLNFDALQKIWLDDTLSGRDHLAMLRKI